MKHITSFLKSHWPLTAEDHTSLMAIAGFVWAVAVGVWFVVAAVAVLIKLLLQ